MSTSSKLFWTPESIAKNYSTWLSSVTSFSGATSCLAATISLNTSSVASLANYPKIIVGANKFGMAVLVAEAQEDFVIGRHALFGKFVGLTLGYLGS
jgi:hypothetical protein